MKTTLTKGNLTLILDDDSLAKIRTELLHLMDLDDCEEYTNKKSQSITKADFEEAVNRLYNLAIDIMDENLNIDIWEYLPYTKEGKFHKSNSVLIATSGIKNVWNGDYFSLEILDLRFIPYAEEKNHRNFKTWDEYLKATKPDGTKLKLCLGWSSSPSKNEVPIFDGNNVPKKVEKKRNTYLKEENLKPGNIYIDKNDIKYLYLGYIDRVRYDSDAIITEEEFLRTSTYKMFYDAIGGTGNYNWNHSCEYCYIKISKKFETATKKNNIKTIGELFQYLIQTEGEFWFAKMKRLMTPMKFISEDEHLLDKTMEKHFFLTEDRTEQEKEEFFQKSNYSFVYIWIR